MKNKDIEIDSRIPVTLGEMFTYLIILAITILLYAYQINVDNEKAQEIYQEDNRLSH